MSEPSSNFEVVLSEHQHLNELFARISELFAKSAKPSDLLPLMEELQSRILCHFEHEEADGFFDRIAAEAPRLQEEALQLKGQHQSLASSLREVLALLGDDARPTERLEAASAQFADFQEQFSEHEEGENRLLQEAYDRDVGAKD